MLRLSNIIRAMLNGEDARSLDGKIAILNLTNRCNLTCLHCYSKASLDSKDSLTTSDIMQLLPSLVRNNIKFIILSGGEPLTRADIFDISAECKKQGIVTYLSTNGLYIHKSNVQKISESFNYIGVSVDGSEYTHDYFRGITGVFHKTIDSIRLLLEYTKRVGIRFTLTSATLKDLPFIFELAEKYNIPKIYISHLVYSGRGSENRSLDLNTKERLGAVCFIMDKAFEYYDKGINIDIVTGNMEVDAVLLYKRFKEEYPGFIGKLKSKLISWGGNSAGVKLVNIDSYGDVKPDPFFPISIGNIKESSFDEVWQDDENPILYMLRRHPRILGGKCAECEYLSICNGGSRSRAYAVYGYISANDPSCYLNEINNRSS